MGDAVVKDASMKEETMLKWDNTAWKELAEPDKPMTDDQFVSELRRHILGIIKAIFKRYGIDLLKQ